LYFQGSQKRNLKEVQQIRIRNTATVFASVVDPQPEPDPAGSGSEKKLFRIRAARIRKEFEKKKLFKKIHNFPIKCTKKFPKKSLNYKVLSFY
jgi:hypothetical protein